jgi:hypothetical protein
MAVRLPSQLLHTPHIATEPLHALHPTFLEHCLSLCNCYHLKNEELSVFLNGNLLQTLLLAALS